MGGLLRLLGLVLLVLVVHYPLFGDGAVMGRRAALGDNGLSHFNVTDSNRNVSAVHDHPRPGNEADNNQGAGCWGWGCGDYPPRGTKYK
nr:hypothetical protein Iba_chr11cCG1900 [Ipomoea batatas]